MEAPGVSTPGWPQGRRGRNPGVDVAIDEVLRPSLLAVALAYALTLLVSPAASSAAEPPNGNDPCSSAGRNTCGTLGVGSYEESRYGIRWFGDFHGAVPGEAHTFCIDFRHWYASPDYRYREQPGGLRNRDGEAVPLVRQRRLAYAIWTYGRSAKPHQQAAVALYVHTLVGDARPGEADPSVLGPAAAAVYRRVARDAARYHGPYRIEARFAGDLASGREATATVRILSGRGYAVPGVRLAVAARGATGAARELRTNAKGVARVSLTPSGAGPVRLSVEARTLASTLPRIFRPTTAAAAPNGQRLAAPASQTVSAAVRAVAKRPVDVATVGAPPPVSVGRATSDRIAIRGAAPSRRSKVEVRIHGPFPSVDAIRCIGTPAWRRTFTAKGPGVFRTPSARLERVGWYAYVEVVPGDRSHAGSTTRCASPAKRFRVEARPRVRTVISSRQVRPGTAVFDRVRVDGLAGQGATVHAALYGPFATRRAISCAGTPIWTGSFAAAGDGEHRTASVTLSRPGFYTYREWIPATGFVRATRTRCGEEAETTIVRAQPAVTTVVSAEVVRPGVRIFDRIRVSGLGRSSAAIAVELFGPFASRSAMQCDGTPYWSGRVTARGDGELSSPGAVVAAAGFYTYRERLLGSDAVTGLTTECALASETALAAPRILTGRGDNARRTPARRAGADGPARVRLAAVGIDAPVAPVEIDVAGGALGAPPDVSSAAWWRDGAAPGSRSGAILITGHVDLAREGRGAFFALRRARPGARVQVESADGRTFAYRVVSIRSHRKEALPTSVYSRRGPPRLVLVTCGGPFDANAGRYRDNVVVTAVPLGH
jgi:hypothetical protein